MATKYTFNFSDTLKVGFDVQSYTTNGPISSSEDILLPNATSANTTLKLYGKGLPDYGEGIEQNLIYMLEKFANSTSPVHPIEGQDWWNNFVNELKVYNGVAWEAVILASGISPMTGTLDMGASGSPAIPTHKIINLADPSSGQDAMTFAYANSNYVNVSGDTMIGQLLLSGSPVSSSAAISKQYADGAYIATTGDTMTGVLILAGGPATDLEAATKKYVDDQILGTTDKVLDGISFEALPQGSPDISVVATANTMIFSRSGGLADIQIVGLDYDGKLKPATDISVIPTGNVTSITTQAAITELDVDKLAKSGDVMSGVLDMSFNVIDNVGTPLSDLHVANKIYVDSILTSSSKVYSTVILTDGITDTYTTFDHNAGDNKVQIYINGQKKYANTYGLTYFEYARTVFTIDDTTLTYLDEDVIDYNFDISIDGGSPLFNITLPASGSPAKTLGVVTHNDLLSTIGTEIFFVAGVSLDVRIANIYNAESITSTLSGVGSSITISPSGSGTYLFDIPAGISITAVNLDIGSPLVDSFEVTGDQTSNFPIGKKFTVRNSATDNSDSPHIDSVYTVLTSSFGTVTTIQVEELVSRDGNITTNGTIFLTHLAGLAAVSPTSGIDYDFEELTPAGSPVVPAARGNVSSQIRFNTVLPANEQIEIIKLS